MGPISRISSLMTQMQISSPSLQLLTLDKNSGGKESSTELSSIVVEQCLTVSRTRFQD